MHGPKAMLPAMAEVSLNGDAAVPGPDIHTTAGKLSDLIRRNEESVHAGSAKLVDLDERVVVHQLLDPLSRGHLALGVSLVDRFGRPGVHGLLVAPDQVTELAGRRVDVGTWHCSVAIE